MKMGKNRKVVRYELYLLMFLYKLKYIGFEFCFINED